jgi:hypothetical protein
MTMRPYIQLWIALQTAALTALLLRGIHVLELGWYSDKTGILAVLVKIFIIFYIKNIFDFISLKRDISQMDHLMASPSDGMKHVQVENVHHIKGNVLKVWQFMSRKFRKDNDIEEALSYWLWPLERRYELMRHGSSVIVTLGLIGTLAGLIMTIGGLEGVMAHLGAHGDPSSFSDELSQTLGGMSTAFYTTFFGTILGSALLKTLALLTHLAGLSAVRELRHFLMTNENVVANHWSDMQRDVYQDESRRDDSLISLMDKMDQMIEQMKKSDQANE